MLTFNRNTIISFLKRRWSCKYIINVSINRLIGLWNISHLDALRVSNECLILLDVFDLFINRKNADFKRLSMYRTIH
jgi:hypothetical protein